MSVSALGLILLQAQKNKLPSSEVWVTTEPSLVVPVEILQSFYVLAWDSLEHMLQSQNQGQGHDGQGQGEKGQGDGEDEGRKTSTAGALDWCT